MYVGQLMTTSVGACSPDVSLNEAARLFWERDCGIVPVIDGDRHVLGVITDRDICLAAYFKNQPLTEIPVSSAMSRIVHTCRTDATLEDAERIMREERVRRLPVVDEGGHLTGIVSLNDLARETIRPESHLSARATVETLAAVCEPHRVPAETE